MLLSSYSYCLAVALASLMRSTLLHQHLKMLALFMMIMPISAVCAHCRGAADTCTGNTATCPWVTGIAANAATMAAGVSGVLILTHLLPLHLQRLFPKTVLSTLSMLNSRSTSVPFDPTGKTMGELRNAIMSSQISKADALLHVMSAMDGL